MQGEITGTSEERVGYLDGLRGIAVLLVVCGHFFADIYIFRIGWVGLNLFFVLSGYLITRRLFVHSSGNTLSYFKNFYIRRILRIFPLYYGCLILFFVLLPFLYSDYFQLYGSIYEKQIWYWTYTSNWMMIWNGLPPVSIFFHFWSLAVEEQFYIVWPFLFIMLLHVRHLQRGILFLILVSIILRCSLLESNMASYLSTFTAMEPLLLGALVAVLEKNGVLARIFSRLKLVAVLAGISLLLILIHNSDLQITNDWLFYAGYSAIDLLWIYILVSCITGSGRIISLSNVFSSSLLRWCGKYSYGIYVFHWIVLNPLVYKTVNELEAAGVEKNIAYFSVRIAGILMVFFISYLSFNFFEKYFLRLKRYFN